jgi:hypothetical protein
MLSVTEWLGFMINTVLLLTTSSLAFVSYLNGSIVFPNEISDVPGGGLPP